MRLNMKKLLSILICLSLLATTFLCNFAFSADATVEGTNLISGQLPVQFTAAGSLSKIKEGNYDRQCRYFPISNTWYDGYTPNDTDTKEDWASYLANMTDNDLETTTGIRQRYDGDYISIAYKFDTTTVKSFSITSTEQTNARNIYVYVSDFYTTLFSDDSLVYTGTTDPNFSVNLKTEAEGSYIAFVTNDRDFSIKEIGVYGDKQDDSGNQPTNILSAGQLPVQFAAAGSLSKIKEGNFDRQCRYFPISNTWYDGYSPDNTDTKEDWASYLANMTDNDLETATGIRERYDGDYISIAYGFESTKIGGFSITSTEQTNARDIYVYVSDFYTTLFSDDSLVYSGTTDPNFKVTLDAAVEGAYIAFITNDRDFSIKEIEVYGTSAANNKQESLLTKGQTPVQFAAANSFSKIKEGNYDRECRYFPVSNTWYDGYTPNDTDTKEDWASYLANMTDDDLETTTGIRQRYDGDYISIAYEFPLATVTGFSITSTEQTHARDIYVYVSDFYTTLFSDDSLVYTGTTNPNFTINLDKEVEGSYIAFVTNDRDFSIKEIAITGIIDASGGGDGPGGGERPDYGTNLIAGMLPMSVFIAEREYPLPHTGDRIYKLMEDKDRTTTLEMLTDGDFTKSFSWYHDNTNSRVNKESRYKVLAYDLGSVSKIDKILIASKCGGYDIFVSDDYNNLYNPDEKRVYSSGGDQLLPDGSDLDPSTDLTPGENLIELSDVQGRYVGIVITRGSRLGNSDNEAVYMSEIQIFGEAGNSNYGDNLILGKTPIFNYRARYGKYKESLGETFVEGGGAPIFTDGDRVKITEMIMPNTEGRLGYSYGVNVMIYYLEGTCDVNAFSMYSQYYYAPGGLDIYVSNSFDTLLDSESCVFTTGGETADNGVYDRTKDLGAVFVSSSLKTPKEGRYVAFVFTRFYDSQINGWGQLQIRELEVYGKVKKPESLPSTTLVDKKSGISVKFTYKNPDETFLFASSVMKTFRLRSVDSKEYSNEIFSSALKENSLKIVGNAFYLEFLDENGKVVPQSQLEGKEATVTFNFDNSDFKSLAIIRNNSIYIEKSAEQNGNVITYTTDGFDKLFALVTFDENAGMNKSELGVASVQSNKSDQSAESENENENESYDYSYDFAGDSDYDFALPDEDIFDAETDVDGTSTNPKRKWVSVDVDDPLEWFWNIYDTFAANIWMLIVSALVLALGISAIVVTIVYTVKRRRVQ